MSGGPRVLPTLMRSDLEAATVEITVPAHPALVATIRSVARAAALLADLPFGDIEELQIAVDEAAILLLPLVTTKIAEPRLTARFEIGAGRVQVAIEAPCREGARVDIAGMAWMVLTGLDPTVTAFRDENRMTLAFERRTRAGEGA